MNLIHLNVLIKNLFNMLITNNELETRHYDQWIYHLDKVEISSNQFNVGNFPNISYNDADYSTKILFFINQIPYYEHGNKKIIHDRMLIFKDNDMIQTNDQEPVILQGNVKQYMVNIYLNTIVNRTKINLNLIEPSDIFDFLKFLEQYPADCLSIGMIDRQLIDYFNYHDIDPKEINSMCQRCELKLMYLYINQNALYSHLCRERF